MNRGFTLIELLVVTGIIVILTALILPNYRTGGQQLALQRSAHKLTQDIRRVEELTMSAKEFQGQVPLGGYGVYFNISEEDHYILFADLDGNYQYDEGFDGLVEDVEIEKEVKISQLSFSPLNITFVPPDPEVIIRPDADLAQITLSLKADSAKTKIINVNKAGLIYLETPLTCLTNGSACSSSGACCSSWCGADSDSDTYYAEGSGTCMSDPGIYDCYDANANARPGSITWSSSDRGDGSFDYNCDGVETKHPDWNCVAASLEGCYAGQQHVYGGFIGSVPACGASGTVLFKCTGYNQSDCKGGSSPATMSCTDLCDTYYEDSTQYEQLAWAMQCH